MDSSILEDVKAHPFSKGLTPEHCETLASLGRRVRHGTDEILFPEGDEKHEFFLLSGGRVALESIAQGKPLRVQTVEAGEGFGYKIMHRLPSIVSGRLNAARAQLLDMHSPIARPAGA